MIGFAFVVIAWMAPGATGAVPPPTAASVLASVQKFYANAKTLTGDFKQVAIQTTFGKSHTSTGKLYLAKPDKMRFDYDKQQPKTTGKPKPPEIDKNFIFDGTTLWIVEHGNKQVIQSAASSSALPIAIAFLSGTANLGQVNAALNTTVTYGGTGATVLELTPKQPQALWQQLFLVVDPTTGQVNESVVLTSNGDSNDITFTNQSMTKKVPATLFVFNRKSVPTYKIINVTAPGGSGSGASPPAPGGSGSGASPPPAPTGAPAKAPAGAPAKPPAPPSGKTGSNPPPPDSALVAQLAPSAGPNVGTGRASGVEIGSIGGAQDPPRPASGRISIASKQTSTASTLTPDLVVAKLQSAYLAGVKRCYREVLKQDPLAGGKLTVSFTVDATGRATAIKVSAIPTTSTTTTKLAWFDQQLSGCVSALAGSWRFAVPKDDQGSAIGAGFDIVLNLVPD